jgi:hypothetical protein
MQIDLYGLGFQTPGISFFLWSPWRAAALETKLFEGIARVTGLRLVQGPDEIRLDLTEAKQWRQAVTSVARVMKGWQEEAEPGNEKRSWRWLLECDTDSDGYDHNGERAAVWGFLRVGLDRGNPAEGEKGEDFDLDNFGFRILPVES